MAGGLFYGSGAKSSGLTVSVTSRQKALEDENAGLKMMLAGQTPNMAVTHSLPRKMVAPAVKREAVAPLKAHLGLPERRACENAGAGRKMVRDQSLRARNTILRGAITGSCQRAPRSVTGGSSCQFDVTTRCRGSADSAARQG